MRHESCYCPKGPSRWLKLIDLAHGTSVGKEPRQRSAPRRLAAQQLEQQDAAAGHVTLAHHAQASGTQRPLPSGSLRGQTCNLPACCALTSDRSARSACTVWPRTGLPRISNQMQRSTVVPNVNAHALMSCVPPLAHYQHDALDCLFSKMSGGSHCSSSHTRPTFSLAMRASDRNRRGPR
jgi:hypothetical protein